jgi:hypothetical protein
VKEKQKSFPDRYGRLARIAASLALVAGAWLGSRDTFRQAGPLVLDESFGKYRVKIYWNDNDGWLDHVHQRSPVWLAKFIDLIHPDRPSGSYEVLRDGKRMYSAEGDQFWLADVILPIEGGTTNVPILGRDINGDGVPDLAIATPYGRLGGQAVHVFACGQEFHETCVVRSLDHGPVFRDYDGDGVAEVLLSDDTFYHWPAGFDGEPMPKVILRWRNKAYEAAPDLMWNICPDLADLPRRAEEIRQSPEWALNPDPDGLFATAVQLMYCGHEELGWQFLKRAGNPDFPLEPELLNWLRGRINESPYWQRLRNCTDWR